MPADMNDLQDQIITLWQTVRWKTAPVFNGKETGSVTVTRGDNLSITHTSAAGGVYRIPIIVHPGQRITGVRARVTPAASASLTVGLQKITDGSVATVGSQSPASSGTSTQTIQRTDLAEDVINSPTILYCVGLFFPASAPNSVVLAAEFAITGRP